MTIINRSMTDTRLPEPIVRSTRHWARRLAQDWRGEMPARLHTRELASDGAPQWSPDFYKYITRNDNPNQPNPPERTRTTRAFRRLREKAVREYEVLYRLVSLGGGHLTNADLEATAEWLNERSARHGHSDRYDANDVLIMVHSAIDKVTKWR